jgi:hypothetical protein
MKRKKESNEEQQQEEEEEEEEVEDTEGEEEEENDERGRVVEQKDNMFRMVWPEGGSSWVQANNYSTRELVQEFLKCEVKYKTLNKQKEIDPLQPSNLTVSVCSK